VSELLSVPFTLHFVFRIENRHGFNTMTFRLWLADFLKGTLLSMVLLTFFSFAGFWLIVRSPGAWWFWIWCFSLAFTIFLTYVSPYVIEPLFNKFTPVQDDDLKVRIVQLADLAGINVSKVLRMDASKRSTHTNAYFTGIGRTKRIILFDTLIQNMVPDEILAVLAHEIGHWKRRHLLKGLALTQLASLVLLFCAYRAMISPFISHLFGIAVDTLPAKAVIVAFLFSIISFFLKPAMNGFSRMLEREADRVSCELTGKGETMVRVLVKLSKDNLSNLFPHPLYAFFTYSHPPVLERIGYIRAYARKKGERTG
jgi:STE24 endopeptidase